jgi:hypothetical protein
MRIQFVIEEKEMKILYFSIHEIPFSPDAKKLIYEASKANYLAIIDAINKKQMASKIYPDLCEELKTAFKNDPVAFGNWIPDQISIVGPIEFAPGATDVMQA